MDFSGFSVELFLFSIAVVAGFIDTLAGGGGLITMPALLVSGVPPLATLGTNKLQGSMGTAMSTYMMLKNKRVHWHDIKYLMLFSFIGATLGAIVVQLINVDALTSVIPLVLLFIIIYFIISPKSHNVEHKAKISKFKYQYIVIPSIACYDGMFGPGTGSFFSLAGVSLRGHGFIDATAIAKGLNFSSNIASLVVFLLAGQVVWLVGITMMFGQAIGAWLGSHCLLRINPAYLRTVVVVMCLGMLLKYGFSIGWF